MSSVTGNDNGSTKRKRRAPAKKRETAIKKATVKKESVNNGPAKKKAKTAEAPPPVTDSVKKSEDINDFDSIFENFKKVTDTPTSTVATSSSASSLPLNSEKSQTKAASKTPVKSKEAPRKKKTAKIVESDISDDESDGSAEFSMSDSNDGEEVVVAPRATRNRRNRTPVKSYTLESDGEASVIELSEDEEYV